MPTTSEHCLLELHQSICTLAAAVSTYGQDQNTFAEKVIIEKWHALNRLIATMFNTNSNNKRINDGMLDCILEQLNIIDKLIATINAADRPPVK